MFDCCILQYINNFFRFNLETMTFIFLIFLTNRYICFSLQLQKGGYYIKPEY